MEWDQIIKQAKSCCTKEAWNHFFECHGKSISQLNQSKPILEIFKFLSRDQQSLNYDPELWVNLLAGCLSSWDLDLGIKIAQFTEGLIHPKLSIFAAEVFLESGLPSTARRASHRALRLKLLTEAEMIQLQMILCKTYVEEGRQRMANRLLTRLTTALGQASLEASLKAEILTNMARTHFFLGKYLEAASLFQDSYLLFEQLQSWEAAAKGLFNAAASLHNSGASQQQRAFDLVKMCFNLSTEYDLKGPLSHCYAFYGTHEYQLGNFTQAAKYYRRALAAIPLSDQSFRRLHILSMLTLSYLKKGQYRQAFHHGAKTMELARQDESDRFKSRYISLESEINWQSGKIELSQSMLRKAVKLFQTQGVQTLEQLSTLSRFYTQSALLNEPPRLIKPKISNRLKDNACAWSEFLIARSDLFLTQGQYLEAERLALRCYGEANERKSRYFVSRSLVNLVQSRLARNLTDETLFESIRELEDMTKTSDFDRLKVHVHIAQASLAYRQGNFQDCLKMLHTGLKCQGIPFSYREIIQAWLATCEGRAAKINPNWKAQMVTRATRIYFSPSIRIKDGSHYVISQNYEVSLESHPILAQLMQHLVGRSDFKSDPQTLQELVWAQSLSSQGWQQKVRNALMRLRSIFAYTVAPLVIHDHDIRLNSEAIRIINSSPEAKEDFQHDRLILSILQGKSLSSSQISTEMQLSNATIKRILKKLVKDDMVSVQKIGRNVLYQAQLKNHISPMTPIMPSNERAWSERP